LFSLVPDFQQTTVFNQEEMKVAVGILGATGTVGQRFIELLQIHPIFYVKALGASERSAGKPFKEACNWKMTTEIPSEIAEKEGAFLRLTSQVNRYQLDY